MIAQIDRQYLRLSPLRGLRRLLSYGFFEGRPLTTRGRWINPLLFSCFSLYESLPQMQPVEAPIFVIGTGRSGTTILGVVLSMHRDIGFLNEPKAMWHAILRYEDLVGSYSLGEARYRLGEQDASPAIKQRAHRLFGAYLALSRSKRVCDKYPELIFRADFVRAIFPDARFVFLVRDGWDTCGSIERWSREKGKVVNGSVQDWWGVDNRKWRLLVNDVAAKDDCFSDDTEFLSKLTDHRHMAAVEWILAMREGLALIERSPAAVQLVRYEALSRDPEGCLGDLLRALDLRDDAKCLAYARQTLKAVSAKPTFDLPEQIAVPFEQTMRDLGYRV